MAWLGESFANIKGQITSFTKEVLTADDDDDVSLLSPEEVRAIRNRNTELEKLCSSQEQEIAQLRSNALESGDNTQALEQQMKTVTSSYQELIRGKDEENKRLQEQLELLDSTLKQIEAKSRENADSSVAARVSEFVGEAPSPSGVLQFSDAETLTDETVSDDEILKRELEERCSLYQNDLFVLRGELMSLQNVADHFEESNAKMSEDILDFLHSHFMVDGEAALLKGKRDFHQNEPEETRVVSSLRQLEYWWRDLVEKKATLERTVAKLSSHGQTPQSELPADEQSLLEDPHSESNGLVFPSISPADSSSIEPFFPSKTDSFVLETILEEDRGEEEGRYESSEFLDEDEHSIGPGGVVISHNRRKRTPSPATTVFSSNSSTQTEHEEDVEEPTRDRDVLLLSSSTLPAHDHQIELGVLEAKAEKWAEQEKQWLSKMEEREGRIRKLESDLERLRTHLVDLEEQYTNEALLSEAREEQLRGQVIQLKKDLAQTLQQNERSVDVREEIAKLTQERNAYRGTSTALEDQIQRLNTQLNNLHFVLEQFQKEKETEIASITKRLGLEMSQLEQKNEVLRKELEKEEALLEKAKSGLNAAHQLNAQIEEKTRSIAQLRTQVQEKDAELSKLKSQMSEVANNLDGKIDRYLIKNLVVGYFSTPPDKRTEVLRVIATILDFNREDRQKTGLESSSIWPFSRGSTEASGDTHNQSLSEAFIHFLENESKPKVELRMSVGEITRRNSRSSGSTSSALPPGTSPRDSPNPRNSSPTHGVPEISVSLPVLNQADRSNSILKDVLSHKP